MKTSDSRKRSFSSSGLPTTGDVTTAVGNKKHKKKKHSVKHSDEVEAPAAAAITTTSKYSKRQRRREKGRPNDGSNRVHVDSTADVDASDQPNLEPPQRVSIKSAVEPVMQKTATAHKASSTGRQTNGKGAKTAALMQHLGGKSADVVAAQLKMDEKKARKARTARQAREAAARESGSGLATLASRNSKPSKKLKKNANKDLADITDEQRRSTSTARAALSATFDAHATLNSDESRGSSDFHHSLLKPFEMDWDVIETRAAEKIAAGDVDWNKITADQRTQLTRHYIGHPSNIDFAGSVTRSLREISEAAHDDSDDGSESSSCDNSAHSVDYLQSPAALDVPESQHEAQSSQPQIARGSRLGGQSGTFKPRGDRRLSAVPSRLGTFGTLADTKAKFQRLSKALNERRGRGSSDDSDSDSSSESQSDDGGVPSKPIIRGSVSETFANPTPTLRQGPTNPEPESLHIAEASNTAIQPEPEASSTSDEHDLGAEGNKGIPVRSGTVLDPEVAIDFETAPPPRSREQVPSMVQSFSEDEDSEGQSRASSQELAEHAGPLAAPELDGKENVTGSDSDEASGSSSAGEGTGKQPAGTACQTTPAELAQLEKDCNSAESEDESMNDASPAGHSEPGDISDSSEHDHSEDGQLSTEAALATAVLDTSLSNDTARQAILIQRGEDDDNPQNERINDRSSHASEDDDESEGEEIVLNDDGELVLASTLASRQPSPRANLSETADATNGPDEDDVDESVHDADDLEQIVAPEFDEGSTDISSEPGSRPDSTTGHVDYERLEDGDDESDALKEATAPIADPVAAAFQQSSTTSPQQAAGTGSLSPEPSTTANVDIKIKQLSSDRGGMSSGLSPNLQAPARSSVVESLTFQDFTTVTPTRPNFDLEEQEEVSDAIQNVLSDTRPLPEGEDPDEISASQAGSEHELIKDNGSISQDSTVLSSASADADHGDKVRMGAPLHHASQDPPPPLDLSDSDTDSSEDECDDSVVADDDEKWTVAEPSCANDALDVAKADHTVSPLPEIQDQKYGGLPPEVQAAIATALGTPQTSSVKKRKMTGNTSAHFATPSKVRSSKKQPLSPPTALSQQQESSQAQTSDTPAVILASSPDNAQSSFDPGTALSSTPSARAKRSPTKRTGTISEHFIEDRVDLYNTTAGKRRRVAAGESANPFPAIDKPYFGIIQERTWHEPFYLIVATVFLNKTTGRQAAPTFWKIRKRWPSPAELANADYNELFEMIKHLGLQHQRTKRLKSLAAAWHAHPPQAGKRHRTLHYPSKGDGKDIKKDAIIGDDADDCAGALEIAHLPGCGAYAYDSWRIFCRDVLRGVATDYQGANAKSADFEPEWKRVLPGDKELRACLRWMWLKEGIIWDPLTGEKCEATEEEMDKARRGELQLEDEGEAKFAAQAAGVDITSPGSAARGDDALDESPQKRSTLQAEQLTALKVDTDADWALQNSQLQASTSSGHDLASTSDPAQHAGDAAVEVDTSAPPTTRITRAAKSSVRKVDAEYAESTPARGRGRPGKAGALPLQPVERPQDSRPSAVTRSTRAKRQRSPSVEVDEARGSPVAKRRKTMVKKEVVKEAVPKRQSARLTDHDGLV